MHAIKFKNFTNEDFAWKFDGVEYNFPAGQETFMEDFKAHHFAKHLVDRELNKVNIRTNDLGERAKLEAQCFPSDEVVTPAEALNLNEVKKAKKTKKVVEEFPDLKTDIKNK